MKKATLLGLALCAMSCIAVAATATTSKKKAVKRRTHAVSASSKTSKTSATKTTTRTATKSKTGAGKSRTAATKSGRRKTPVRSARTPRQLAPTKERYQQIQQALASKGYFTGDANGQWGADSVEALKRFQADQNLTPDGKLTSLSLIALGLGPKRLSAQSTEQPSHAGLQQ